MQWIQKKIWTAALALAVVYIPVALYLKYIYPPYVDDSYVPAVGPQGQKFRLFYDFPKFQNSEFAYVGKTKLFSRTLNALSDSIDDISRSPILLYENDRLLGPAHSRHINIAKLGGGRYSHWTNFGIIFSTSDNSDPNTNGRAYWAVVPPGVSK